MMVNVPHFSFRFCPKLGKRYKSIEAIAWDDIPPFSVITGENGSGKTQLLELIYRSIGRDPASSPLEDISTDLAECPYEPGDALYVPSDGVAFVSGHASLNMLSEWRRNLLTRLRSDYNKNLAKIFNLLPNDFLLLNEADQQKLLTDNIVMSYFGPDISQRLGFLFISHTHELAMRALARESGATVTTAPTPAPWDVLNSLLSRSGLNYRVSRPHSLTDDFEIKAKDMRTGIDISLKNLSSGEQSIFKLVLWLYQAKNGNMVKLLLLDEPDAHLHPAMLSTFIGSIKDVLVKQHGVRVVMTTHSASTVAYSPLDALFEMRRGSATVSKVSDRQGAISSLTAGIVIVTPAIKICFVEAQNDVKFYSMCRDILVQSGPSQLLINLPVNPPLAFIPVSISKQNGDVGGGKNNVEAWVKKTSTIEFSNHIAGIIDGDSGNIPSGRLFVLPRYCIENYLVDPINIYSLLSQNGCAFPISNIGLSQGEEYLLRTLTSEDLQKIANEVCSRIVAVDSKLNASAYYQETYCSGQSIKLPGWVKDVSGKKLTPTIRLAFPDISTKINNDLLGKSLRTCRMLPVDLRDHLASAQSN